MSKLIIPVKDIHQAITGLIPVTSKDKTRYTMQGIRLRVKGDKLELAASDGHIASILEINASEFIGLEFGQNNLGERILGPDLLQAIKRMKGTEPQYTELHLTEENCVLCSSGRRSEFAYVDGKYPDLEHVFNASSKTFEGGKYVAFNAELLLAAAKSLAMAEGYFRKGVVGTKLLIPMEPEYDEKGNLVGEKPVTTSPLAIEKGNHRALVMPMRL